MADANGYATRDLVESVGNLKLTEAQRAQWRVLLTAAENTIDQITGRSFVADGTAEAYVTRLFDGDGTRTLVVDDLLTLNELTVDDIVVAATDYVLKPTNTTPKTTIVLLYSAASTDRENVDVEGIWGYSETPPEAIQLATAILIARKLSAPPWLRSQAVDGYAATYAAESGGVPDEVRQLVGPYIRYDVVAV
jgi:hypothetical protein